MSGVLSNHFKLNNAYNIIWIISISIGLCVLIICIFIFLLIIQHLHCVPTNHFKHQNCVKTHSTIAATFAVSSAIFSFSWYPVCAKWDCSGFLHTLGYPLNILDLFWNFYFLSKFFLYLIFIDRLFNHNYRNLYQYPKCIQYFLWTLLIVLLMTMITFDIYSGLTIGEIIEFPLALDIVCAVTYAITDCIMSIISMILFIRPIWSARSETSVSVNIDRTTLKKYAMLSVLQLFIAVSFDLMLLSQDISRVINVSINVNREIDLFIQMVDCLLLINCIYIGFAPKQTVCSFIIYDEYQNIYDLCKQFFDVLFAKAIHLSQNGAT